MDTKTLQNIISKENAIVLFYADWCGGCKVARPRVKMIADKLNFRLIEINEDQSLEDDFEVDYYPHVILSHKGKIKHYPGLYTINELYESLI
jgi:thiol-disulfide isomerase/thioredoxin